MRGSLALQPDTLRWRYSGLIQEQLAQPCPPTDMVGAVLLFGAIIPMGSLGEPSLEATTKDAAELGGCEPGADRRWSDAQTRGRD